MHALTNRESTLQQEPAHTKTQVRTYSKHTNAIHKTLSLSRALSLSLSRTHSLKLYLLSLSLTHIHTHTHTHTHKQLHPEPTHAPKYAHVKQTQKKQQQLTENYRVSDPVPTLESPLLGPLLHICRARARARTHTHTHTHISSPLGQPSQIYTLIDHLICIRW